MLILCVIVFGGLMIFTNDCVTTNLITDNILKKNRVRSPSL